MNVLIAMSGGVDSAVAGILMQKAGHSCQGGIMHLFDGALHDGRDIQDAQAVAEQLGIPLHVLDLSPAFREKVMKKFVCSYEAGLTPNPCLDCNRHLKFSLLLEKARELGCTDIATGHYARIRKEGERYLLYRAADKSKDQSYVLYSLTQAQLAHIHLPLGDLTKAQAREIAENANLSVAHKSDSQDICFVPDGDYVGFMKRFTGKEYPAGVFLDLEGKPVGTHCGAVCYTIGQRKGLGLAMGAPVYVCHKDMAANTVTVGPEEALYSNTLLANDWNFIPFDTLKEPIRVTAKARYRHIEQPATAYPEENGFLRVVFDTPQRAITPGQAVVLYQGDLVIGGGTITGVGDQTVSRRDTSLSTS